jgi:hypothetical protein
MKMMKKFMNLAFMSMVTLIGAVSITSCSSSDDALTDGTNPVVPNGESVKTQFTISLPENIKMRMASATVQETGASFRGIDNIKLVPYSLGTGAAAGVTKGSTANANLFALSALTAFDNANSNSKVYADVNLTIGTSNFLFYGKAVDKEAGTPIESAADKFKYGALTVTGLTVGAKPTLASVEFTPVPIYGDGTADEKTAINAGKEVGTNLVAALNAVADATPATKLSDNTQPKFKEVTAEQSATINALWNNFKEITTGSSKNIEWVFKELYMNLDGLSTEAAQATVPDGYKMAVAIRTAIETYCTTSATSGVTTAVTLKTDYTGYPASVNLPDGAVRVSYDATTKEFKAVEEMSYSSMDVASLESYVYPANLQYFVNSPIKVSNNVQSPNYGENSWNTILDLYNGTAVTADTRSVAITNQVQYGVARLDALVNGLLAAGEYYDYAGNEVDVTNGFQLTGILVGSQKSVGWNYVTKGTTAYTIYDKTMNGTTAASMTVKREQPTTKNYTLVLQTGEADQDKTVNVALEFINNCPDFVGADGEIIPNGATFYLVGTLKTSEATNKDETTVAAAKDRVFTQDFKTMANFTIKQGTATPENKDGLGTATKGLPDLRTPVMELGLSVDLEWQPGLNFDVEI